MDVLIKKGNKSFKLSDTPITPLRFIVGSIEQNNAGVHMENRAGTIDVGVEDLNRKISIPFFFLAKNLFEFPLIRDEIFGLFGKEPLFIMEQPEQGHFYTGKQYNVRLSEVINIEQHEKRGKLGQGVLVFETTDLPYGQSVMTTQEIQNNGINIDRNWAFGMGLQTVDDTELIYTHNAVSGQSFRIFNAGNVEIHPFETYLKIEIKKVIGSTVNFQITNLTNSSRMRINVPVKNTDVFVYNGPNITRNSLAAAKDTRKDFISLAPGWNNLQIYFCDSAEVSFDFGFLYR